MKKPTMVFNYDYEMAPYQERIPYSSAFQLEQSLKKYFDVYRRGEILAPDFAFNTLPRVQHPPGDDFVDGKVSSFWTTSPLEGICEEYFSRSTVNFYSAPSLKKRFPENSVMLLDFVDPHYTYKPQEFAYDIGFLGSEMESHRQEFLNELQKNFRLLRGATDLGKKSAEALSQCKLVISIQDYHNQGFGVERRIFTFGNVRPILIHYNDDYLAIGKPFEHYIPYGSREEAIILIQKYLKEESERERIGENLKRVLLEKHQADHRAKLIYDTYLRYS